jgi:spore coat protein H
MWWWLGCTPAVVMFGRGELPQDWWFADDVVHQIDVTLPEGGSATLDADPYSYITASVVIDGEAVDDIGIRLRGKIGSFRQMSGKPKFRLAFDKYTPDQRFHGMKALSLNNEVADCSYLKEPIGYRIFNDLGIDAPRTGFANVSVDGQPYGLYVLIETPDVQFTERVFNTRVGNLYDGKYIYLPDGNYELLDLTTALVPAFEEDVGIDVGHRDLMSLATALDSTDPPPCDALDAHLDWPRMWTYLAAEQVIGHNDGYALNTNNYRIFFDPADAGKAAWVPWDLDNGFLHDTDWGLSWQAPHGRVAAACVASEDCRAHWKAEVERVLDEVDFPAMQAELDRMDALTIDAATADPRNECEDFVNSRVALRAWFDTEPAAIRTAWSAL